MLKDTIFGGFFFMSLFAIYNKFGIDVNCPQRRDQIIIKREDIKEYIKYE